MFPATDLDNHLVEVPARTGARTAAAKIDGDQSAEFQEPASYGLVRYINATFGQQVLDITKRQGEPSVKPDRVLDNLRRKPMSLERYRDHPETVAAPDRFGHRLNVSMPDEWIDTYNNDRSHQGKICEGRTPLQTLEDGKKIWKKNFLNRI